MTAADGLPLLIFLVDVLVTGTASWLATRASGHGGHGFLEAGLAWLWCCLALVTGAGQILGQIGALHANGFLAAHALALVALLGLRRHHLHGDAAALREHFLAARAYLNARRPDAWGALALLVVVAALTAVAAAAHPSVGDSLSYHLPRVAHWLQEERIHIIDTPDERFNFVAYGPELVTAWLLGATREGFPLVVLGQAAGGILAVGATVGLARASGLGQRGAVLAAAMLFGMASFVAQFTAAQTDLFTTGLFATAFLLWLRAAQRGQVSVPGVLGAGLALGAKGTLFYLGPTALLWLLWFARRHPLGWRLWLRSVLLGAAGILFFAGPLFIRNAAAYGDPLGPPEWVKKHHVGFTSLSELGRKLTYNLSAAFAQNLEPHSQPLGLRQAAAQVGESVALTLPRSDPYTLDNFSRRETLQQVLGSPFADADVATFGGVTLGLFGLGLLAGAVLRGREGRAIVLLWGGGIAGFVLFFHGMHQWHPFSFRYLLLAAPWIAIVGAWGVCALPRPLATGLGAVAVLAGASVATHVTLTTHQAGWITVTAPDRSYAYSVDQAWRAWSQQLEPVSSPLRLALPLPQTLSGFYRQQPPRRIEYVPAAELSAPRAEDLVRHGAAWVIVPASRYLGREGHVIGRVWLHAGDPRHEASIAAYRRPQSGEGPPAVVYRNTMRHQRTSSEQTVQVRVWARTALRLQLVNPTSAPVSYTLSAGEQRLEGSLAAQADAGTETPLFPDTLTTVVVTFHGEHLAAAPARPVARIILPAGP